MLNSVSGHPEYESHARAASITSIVIATGVCIFIVFFRDWGFGLAWFLVLPTLWFAVSILLAMPLTIAKFKIAESVGGNGGKAVGGLLDLVALPIEAAVVYFALRQIHQMIW